MKTLVVLFFGMLLWTQTSLARHAEVSFFSKRGEPFHVVLNGRLINRYAADKLSLPAVPGGFHVAEIRLPGRFGALVHRTRIYVEPGFRTEFMVQLVGRRPKVVVSKVRQYPFPVALRPLPGPYRPEGHYRPHGRHENRHHDRHDHDRYDDRDHHDKDRDDRHDNDHHDNDRYEEHRDSRYEHSYRDRIEDQKRHIRL